MTSDGPIEGFCEEEHPSDALVRVAGATREDVFAGAARACFSLMTDIASVRPTIARDVTCEGNDIEDLLAVWLNRLIGIAGVERLFLNRFDISSLSDTELAARVFGEPVYPERHALKREVKAATYHRLSVRPTEAGWEATVLFDL